MRGEGLEDRVRAGLGLGRVEEGWARVALGLGVGRLGRAGYDGAKRKGATRKAGADE